MTETLLSVEDLKTYFFTRRGTVRAVDGVSFNVKSKQVLGIVGESGSGKTVTALSILRIVPIPGKIISGSILYGDRNLAELPEKEMQLIRGKEISLTFQNPSTSLNPVFKIGDQIVEVIRKHRKLSKEDAIKETVELLRKVGIPDPETRIKSYPHEFSMGQKQRVAFAKAISCRPSLLIADEPTTALDVTIQAQVLDLIKDLVRSIDMSLLLITHNMGVISDMSDQILILYAGRICEYGDGRTILDDPIHPYTKALLKAVPRIELKEEGMLPSIPGRVPNMLKVPHGCRFHPRCQFATAACKEKIPELKTVEDRQVACLNLE